MSKSDRYLQLLQEIESKKTSDTKVIEATVQNYDPETEQITFEGEMLQKDLHFLIEKYGNPESELPDLIESDDDRHTHTTVEFMEDESGFWIVMWNRKEMAETTIHFDFDDVVVLPRHDAMINFSDFSPRDRSKISQLYTENVSSANISTAAWGIGKVFMSAGFITLLTVSNIYYAIATSILLLLTGIALPFYIKKRSTSLDDLDESHPLHEIFETAKENTGIEDARLYISSLGKVSPFTVPFGKPRIYIPEKVVNNHTYREHLAILEHELGHHEYAIGKNIQFLMNILPMILFAPVIVRFVTTDPLEIFGLLVVISLVLNFVSIYLNTLAEYRSDTAMSNPSDIITALLKMSRQPRHIDSTTELVVHHLGNPHPPMNKRIQSFYEENTPEINVSKDTTMSAVDAISALMALLGGVFVGYSFLTYVSVDVPEYIPVIGTLCLLLYVWIEVYSVLENPFSRVIGVGLIAGFGGALVVMEFVIETLSVSSFFTKSWLVLSLFVFALGFIIAPLSLFISYFYGDGPDPVSVQYPATSWEDSVEEFDIL